MFDTLVKQAEVKLQRGDLAGAYNDLRQVLSQTRTHGRAHYVMSLIATAKGARSDALKLCEIAIALDGATAEALGQKAACLFHLGALGEAWTAAKQAVAFEAAPLPVLEKANEIFHAVADYPRFLKIAQRCCAMAPDNDAFLVQVGAGYFLCGRIGEAQRTLRQAIAINPGNGNAICGLTEMRTATSEDNTVGALTGLIRTESDPGRLVALHHALAREYDGLGDAPRAFDCLKRGKQVYRARSGYTVEADVAMFAAIARYIEDAPPPPANASSARPIFVVGMPRSGTTVTQQILTNCQGVVSIGESLQFGALVRTHAGCTSPRLVDATTVEQRWRDLPLDIIGKSYAASGRTLTEGAERFVDKLPLNLLYAPLIVRALPQARIICLRRHPLDTVLGNYRLLAAGTPSYGYGSSLETTALFVAETMRLADRLAERYPEQFLVLDYEKLVAEPVVQAREVLRFCGLPWKDDAVKIENNTAPSGSASAAQVRAPIHKRYVGRWKAYKDFLGEAMAVLDSYGIAYESDD